jgi:hypothetical protein
MAKIRSSIVFCRQRQADKHTRQTSKIERAIVGVDSSEGHRCDGGGEDNKIRHSQDKDNHKTRQSQDQRIERRHNHETRQDNHNTRQLQDKTTQANYNTRQWQDKTRQDKTRQLQHNHNTKTTTRRRHGKT